MPNFSGGSVEIWTMGQWTSQLCDISKTNVNGKTEWSSLRWRADNVEDSEQAYYKVDILDANGDILYEDISATYDKGYYSISLDYNDVKDVDIKIRFRLYGKSKSPIIKYIQLL